MEGIDFYREVSRRLAAGERLAMATVVRTRGSVPRQAGAKMAVTAAGASIGTVGGGYLEHETARAAIAVIADRRPAMLHLKLTADIAASEAAGRVGEMDVFVEPL